MSARAYIERYLWHRDERIRLRTAELLVQINRRPPLAAVAYYYSSRLAERLTELGE